MFGLFFDIIRHSYMKKRSLDRQRQDLIGVSRKIVRRKQAHYLVSSGRIPVWANAKSGG